MFATLDTVTGGKMTHKDQVFATITKPNWFWDVVTKCVENTDKISLRKFIIESDRSSVVSLPSEEEFFNLFKEMAFNFAAPGNSKENKKQ